MTDTMREALLDRFAAFAAGELARYPSLGSILFSVAQYWNDGAQDEVHVRVSCSRRADPVWPHECGPWNDDGPGPDTFYLDDDRTLYPSTLAPMYGEICDRCVNHYEALDLRFWGNMDEIEALEAFCPEDAHQEMEDSHGYAPFAIARRTEAGVAIERVYRPQRPSPVMADARPATPLWDDPRALGLLRELGAAPDDDGPRAVLCDYLLEAYPDEPLGEALALCRAAALDDDARARRDALLADPRWLDPLGQVIARGCAELDRGLLRAADVYADEHTRAAVAGAAAWATVQTIRIAPGSADVVDPEMRALRDIGPLHLDGVRAIADAPRPWTIERLHARLSLEHRDRVIDALVEATTLPRLRELALSIAVPAANHRAAIRRLTAAAWWPAIDRLTLLVPSLEDSEALKYLPALAPMAKQLAIGELGDHGQPAGWQVVFDDRRADRVELAMAGWHARATLGQLRALITALPDRRIALVDSRYRRWIPDDLDAIALPGRDLRIEGRAMSDPSAATRAEALVRFEIFARHLFDQKPAARSIVLSVSQYWNDQADDEIHGWITISERDQPVWPHECSGNSDYGGIDDPALLPTVPGETCEACADDYARYHFPFYGGYGDEVVVAFEAFCPEHAHQDMSHGQGYAPFAIARRAGDGVAIEQVGRPQRPPAVLGETARTSPWDDPRASTLLHEVAHTLDDDGPRSVLSDYLLEAHPDEPLGEALALCLAPALDDAARARRDQLIAAHRDRWLHPLGEVTARGCVELDRGLPRALDVYADEVTRWIVAGAPAWATVETVRSAPGSQDLVDPEMRALRDIGPLGLDGVRAIGDAPRPWQIERLHVRLERGDRDPMVEALVAARTLPRLRELAVSLPWPPDGLNTELGGLTAAPWWPDLERLTLLVSSFQDPTILGRIRARLPLLGKQLAIAEHGGHGHPAGWQVMFDDHARDRVEISQVGWHAGATIAQLRSLIGALPDDRDIVLAPSRYRSWRPDDLGVIGLPARRIRIA